MKESVIPYELKEELEDVARVYNSRSGICTYPNALTRLQEQIIKICEENKELKESMNKEEKLEEEAKEADERIEINSKEEHDKVQKDLLAKGYKWIDGTSKYYDLFEVDHFYHIAFVIHHNNKTFEWNF